VHSETPISNQHGDAVAAWDVLSMVSEQLAPDA